MKISVLASGSSGNSTYIETGESSILVDAGISARRIKKNLSLLGKDVSELDGIFITHEHTDHVNGLERLNRSFGVPVYLNRMTYEYSKLTLNKPNFFINNNTITLKDLKINPVPVSHDAADPCGFNITNDGHSVGVFTDLGVINEEVKDITSKADCMVLEANHDVDLLLNGPYPYHLKERILGSKGHLSNIDAALNIKENASEKLKTVFLAHLSDNNNTEELAEDTFSKLVKNKHNRIIAKKKQLTELVKI